MHGPYGCRALRLTRMATWRMTASRTQVRQQARRASSSSTPQGQAPRAGGFLSGLGLDPKWLLLSPAALALLGGVAYAHATNTTSLTPEQLAKLQKYNGQHTPGTGWETELAAQPGTVRVLTSESLLAQDHPFLEDDHMFSAFVSKGIVQDLTGYYNPDAKCWHSVIALGREVCGFPRVVHGGLTAALFDESFGGLLFSLKQQRALDFWGPAYTVNLEVQYKAKIPAGATLLCSAELERTEGRKLWMTATMRDGPDGKVYATARALFVAPSLKKLAPMVGSYLWGRLFPAAKADAARD